MTFKIKQTSMDWTFGLSAVFATSLGILYRGQSYLVYMPDYPVGSRTNVASPIKYGLKRFCEVDITTQDGTVIVAYLICQPSISLPSEVSPSLEVLSSSSPIATSPSDHKFSDKILSKCLTIIYFHANAGNIGHRLPIAASLYRKAKCNILMVSYRGYGKSQGIPDEAGIQLDAQAALNYVLAHPELGKGKVVLYGQSIGGAVAIDLAYRNPDKVHGLVLENTFLSIPKLVKTILPIGGQVIGGFCNQIWDSESKIPTLGHLPILFLAGTADELVHISHMEGLLNASGQSSAPSLANKSFVAVPEGTHNDTCTHPTYFEVILDFFSKNKFI